MANKVMHTEELIEVVFGLEHMIAEFFWNAVFAVILFVFSKAKALKKIHKYVDNKHGVKHQEEEY